MIKIYCIVCDKYTTFKNPKKSYIFNKILGLSIFCSKYGNEIFKKEESVEILKILGSITNIDKYQKMYNQDWRKLKSRI